VLVLTALAAGAADRRSGAAGKKHASAALGWCFGVEIDFILRLAGGLLQML
jgi:hypothetical protein